MPRLGDACGARSETFSGLAGLGDLVVTCWSRHSRNRRAGELIAQGASPEEAVKSIGMVVEGLTTAEAARRLGTSAATLRVHLYLARRRLRAVLAGESP